MTTLHRQPQLDFYFHTPNGEPSTYHFRDPVCILVAHQVHDVLPCLLQVQSFVQRGFYAAGYLAYEAAPAFDPAYAVHQTASEASPGSGSHMPLLWFGIFREPYEDTADTHTNGDFRLTEWQSMTTEQVYRENIARIHEAIAAGETYQVNYTMRLRAQFAGDDVAFFEQLRRAQNAPHAAYLNLGELRILCASPELFFAIEGSTITTRPMKGTSKRGRWLAEDDAHRQALCDSTKDQAENVMIVDLLRNDLGRIAETGSVQVTRLFDVETYPTVHQMTSTITAKMRANVSLVDVFSALFPCGSITGAPKVSTMRKIAELEDAPRNLYCGTIGFIKPNGDAIFNVAIRTVSLTMGVGADTVGMTCPTVGSSIGPSGGLANGGFTAQAEYGVGGGVTWDSTATGEYAEAFIKANVLTVKRPAFELLETMRLDCGEYILLERHLNRLKASAAYFRRPVDLQHVHNKLADHAALHPNESRKVRLLVKEDGQLHIESTQLEQPFGVFGVSAEVANQGAWLNSRPMDQQPIVIAKSAVSSADIFLYHKTTYRDVYNAYRKHLQGQIDILLWNERGEITEFTTGNVVLQLGDELLTPARDCGLLDGTFRDELLANNTLSEARLTIDDVHRASQIWFINGVRGWIPVYI